MLLANDKSDDLSRMYRLFNRLPKGLEPMAEIIKDHITEVRAVRSVCGVRRSGACGVAIGVSVVGGGVGVVGDVFGVGVFVTSASSNVDALYERLPHIQLMNGFCSVAL